MGSVWGFNMNYLIKILFFLYVIAIGIMGNKPDYLEVSLLLLLIASNIFREKFKNSPILIIVEAVFILYLSTKNQYYIYLYSIIAYDLVKSGYFYISGLLIIPGIIILKPLSLINYCMFLILCGYFAYINRRIKGREKSYREAYDKERQYRYELERTKAEILDASQKIEYLTEVRERNRIAREIHDSVGHSLAGIMMQLQASMKLKGKDDDKSRELLKNSIDGLSDAIVTLRETVHNIKPKEAAGLEYIERIIESFTYCPVLFSKKGNMSLLKSHHIEILSNNIKEALTNISKYSGATKVEISIETNEKYARLYIKDNGMGCNNIKEGLGLSGMRERLNYVGGTISISGKNGFMIVCLIPMG